MEIFTGDRRIPDPNDFPQHICPFPPTGNLVVSSPTTVIHSPESVNRQNLPPQKLRPIRGNGRSPSSSHANHLPPVEAGALDKLGLLGDPLCEASAYFESPEKAQTGDMAVKCVGGPQCVVLGGSEGSGSGTDGGNRDPCYGGGLSEDESGSSSDDDDDDSSMGVKESVSRKRKRNSGRKLENFLQNLVMKVMEKQEQMHKQLIEVIESRERERMLREEAWKQQELERLKRDEELRAQEISRNLALISFIQDVMGHRVELPQPEPSTAKSHVESNVSFQNDFKGNLSNRRWPETEVQALIAIRTTLEQKFRAMGVKSSNIWDEVSATMQNMGYNRSAKKCKEKWENINKYFKRSLESRAKKRYENSKTCPYFHELNVLYKNGFTSPRNADNHSIIGSEDDSCRGLEVERKP